MSLAVRTSLIRVVRTSGLLGDSPGSLRTITFGLVALGVVVLVATIIFWRATRTARPRPSAGQAGPLVDRPAPTGTAASPAGPVGAGVAMTGDLGTMAPRRGRPDVPRIPASVVLFGAASDEVTAAHPVATAAGAEHASTEVSLAEDAASGSRGAVSRPQTELAPETKSLMATLAAVPDAAPTVVRFDDPPVERVVRPATSAQPQVSPANPTTEGSPAVIDLTNSARSPFGLASDTDSTRRVTLPEPTPVVSTGSGQVAPPPYQTDPERKLGGPDGGPARG